jgi:hypothetical protein
VLGGIRSHIDGGWDPGDDLFLDADYFTKIKAVKNAALQGWQVTATDGTVYTFGGPDLAANWPTSESGRYTPLSKHLRADRTRVFDKWYLSEVRDSLGNHMTYIYEAQRGTIQNWQQCETGFQSGEGNLVWYTRSVLPQEIRWSYTDSGAGSYTMRVRFDYTDERADYKVPGQDDDCHQPAYTRKRLQTIFVEVRNKDTVGGDPADDWHVLRKYVLVHLEGDSQSYPCNTNDPNGSCETPCPTNTTTCQRAPSDERHMLLQQIEHYGKDGAGSPLHTYSFSYVANPHIAGEHAAITTNNLRLKTANNG